MLCHIFRLGSACFHLYFSFTFPHCFEGSATVMNSSRCPCSFHCHLVVRVCLSKAKWTSQIVKYVNDDNGFSGSIESNLSLRVMLSDWEVCYPRQL